MRRVTKISHFAMLYSAKCYAAIAAAYMSLKLGGERTGGGYWLSTTALDRPKLCCYIPSVGNHARWPNPAR